jgi:hypothetical protein
VWQIDVTPNVGYDGAGRNLVAIRRSTVGRRCDPDDFLPQTSDRQETKRKDPLKQQADCRSNGPWLFNSLLLCWGGSSTAAPTGYSTVSFKQATFRAYFRFRQA